MPRHLNILLVEDNEDDVFLLQQAFNKAGDASRLQTVSDGVEAIAYLNGDAIYSDRSAHPFPNIMLLDLNMPRMNGFEVLECVRKHPQCGCLVVYILTASSRGVDVQRAYDLRANSYLVKPSRMDESIDFARTLQQWHRFTALPRNPHESEAADEAGG